MKKLLAALAVCVCCICGISAYAEENGYIIAFDDSAPLTIMSSDSALTPLGDSGAYFYAEDEESLKPYLDTAAIVCRNFELELFDYPYTTNDAYFSNQWNHPAMHTEAVRANALSGAGVKIAIIDSGINIYHEDLNMSNVFYAYDCIYEREGLYNVNDRVGHGSFVAGIIAAQTNNGIGIAGIAPDAQLAVFKVTDNGKLSVARLITALNIAVRKNCDVINMSLGAPLNQLGTNEVNLMKRLMQNAYDNNIIVTSSVGNNSSNTLNCPACLDTVIGVGSIGPSYKRSAFANYNESVFVTAPGENLYGLTRSGTSAYCAWEGTSFSTPEIAAAAAIAKQLRPEISARQFMDIISVTADDLGTEGYDYEYGYGLINFERMIKALTASVTIDHVQEHSISDIDTKDGGADLYISVNGLEGVLPSGTENNTASVIFAAYDENGALLSATNTEQDISHPFVSKLYIPPDKKYHSVKMMLWDKLRPLTITLPALYRLAN